MTQYKNQIEAVLRQKGYNVNSGVEITVEDNNNATYVRLKINGTQVSEVTSLRGITKNVIDGLLTLTPEKQSA